MGLIEQVITGRAAQLGALSIRRVLPFRQRRMVGPFIFLDHMGPVDFDAGQGLDVLPHPHIGLETVTYLFEGELTHRDSLGVVQDIRPGELNWMRAGSGVVHSERTPAQLRARGGRLHGLQMWVALPEDQEEARASFHHFDREALPQWREGEVQLTLIAGQLGGHSSPAPVSSPLFYADLQMPAGASWRGSVDDQEAALYLVEGEGEVEGQGLEPGQLVVFEGGQLAFEAHSDCRAMVLGGHSLGERHIRWNFVSSRPERLDEASHRWLTQSFDKVPGESDFVPLPELYRPKPR